MASVSDNYEINVSKKRTPNDKYGIHWCKIELPDYDEDKAKEKLDMLRILFGDKFNINMTHWVCRGQKI